jgi:hypothetical protein
LPTSNNELQAIDFSDFSGTSHVKPGGNQDQRGGPPVVSDRAL